MNLKKKKMDLTMTIVGSVIASLEVNGWMKIKPIF